VVKGMVPDKRAGDWPAPCVEAYKELIASCLDDREDRCPNMITALNALKKLHDEHCPSNLHEVMTMQEEIQHLRDQHRLSQAEREAEEKQKERTCCVCADTFNYYRGVECTPMEEQQDRHFYCNACFEGMCASQTGPEDFAKFVRNECCIVCAYCAPDLVKFSQKQCVNALSDQGVAGLQKARDAAIEARAFQKAQREYERRIQQMREETRKAGLEQQAARVLRARLYIAENILTLKCPRRNCGRAILDFEGCFAVSCTCGCGFCGWCLADCGNDAHAHVKTCKASRNPGGYYGKVGRQVSS
jgi:hypothetical protein